MPPYNANILKVKQAYSAAHAATIDTIAPNNVSGEKRAKAVEAQKLYAVLMNKDIQPRLPPAMAFTHVTDREDAKLLPLYWREEDERIQFWNAMLSKDLIATMLRGSRSVVDINTLLSTKSYSDMWSNRVEFTCDMIHQHMVAPENVNAQLKIFSSGVGVRLSSNIKPKNSEVMSLIRRMNVALYNEEDYGTWLNVPLKSSRKCARCWNRADKGT